MPQPAGPNTVAFDARHPPSPALIDQCVHCGFCLPTCPTYALWGEEMDSPRGRIYLMKMGNEAAAALTPAFVGHFDKCLGCMACVTACPSGVKYDWLIESTRAQIERRYARAWWEKIYRNLLFAILPRPRRLRRLLLPLLLYQRSGMQWLLRRSGAFKLLPARLRALEALQPQLSAADLRPGLPAKIAASGPPRLRVGLLTGCVQGAFFSRVNAATARLLAADGCDVFVPPHQECCGALLLHAGREQQAQALARRLIDVFDREQLDYIAINAAGCGSTMKDYGHLLRDHPEYASRAQAFAARCRDVSEILAELGPRAPRRPLAMRVAYHDACHLQHAQGVRDQPRQALATIPGLEVVEIPESAICCGSAGIYNLVEPAAAQQLGDRKVSHCLTASPDVIVSGNPGCLLQISAGLRRQGAQVPVMHFVELLESSLARE